MNKIEIKNERLKKYLEYELDKEQGDIINNEDLKKINQITIYGTSILGEEKYNDISDLLYFNDLKHCMIKDFCIKDEEIEIINKLQNLETLHFDDCIFKNKQEKINIKINKLVLTFCNNIDVKLFDRIEDLEYLRITSGNKIKLKGIEYFRNIKELVLQSILIKDMSFINKLEKLSYLNLNGSKIIKNKECIERLNIKVEYKKNNFPI